MADATVAGSLEKPALIPDKKKKRRSKKKRWGASAKPPPDLKLEPPAVLSTPQNEKTLSPRKQAILRHRKIASESLESGFLQEVKMNRAKKPGAEIEDAQPTGSNLEDKSLLFHSLMARVTVFHEQIPEPGTLNGSGTLLGHGEFEIFLLHNGRVTYMACGRSFVYPLLPKLKLLRTGYRDFVLPLVNPHRYWKISLENIDEDGLRRLEGVLRSVVNYTSLNSAAGPDSPVTPQLFASHAQPNPGAEPTALSPENHRIIPYFNDIPESPPSAPMSPTHINFYDELPDLLLDKPRAISHKSITSGIASFSVSQIPEVHKAPPVKMTDASDFRNPRIDQAHAGHVNSTKARVHHQSPSRQKAHKPASDASSMDSLLDEYEENISTTKSINYNLPKMPSHARSLASTAHVQSVRYRRGDVVLHTERMSNLGSNYDDTEDKVASSRRGRRLSHGNRSRRSLPSELYTSVSNWMEPGKAVPRNLTHSRSTYSLASRTSANGHVNLADTYKEIYKSITLRNLAQTARETSGSTRSISARSEAPQRKETAVRLVHGIHEKSSKDSLSLSEVYKLLSNREPAPKVQNSIGRFFGW